MTSKQNTLGALSLHTPVNVLMVVAATLLLAVSAHTKVPMWPVPMTLQALAVLMIGLTYGGRLATAALGLYLLQGAAGLPVFASGGGIAQLVGPTGGYLVGFLLAASFLGYASDKGWTGSLPSTLLMLGTAMLFIYVPGVFWLSAFVGSQKAIAVGVLPFLLGDAIKIAIAALLLKPARKAMHY